MPNMTDTELAAMEELERTRNEIVKGSRSLLGDEWDASLEKLGDVQMKMLDSFPVLLNEVRRLRALLEVSGDESR